MKISSLSELKKELQLLPEKDLVQLCTALAKYKKDNKEYLDYLLFAAHNKLDFVVEVKAEIDSLYNGIDKAANLYYTKKSLRKILRLVNKYCKYVSDKAIATDLHIYFCNKLKQSGVPFRKSQLIVNLYEQELKKINALIMSLHEDLQADYLVDLEQLYHY